MCFVWKLNNCIICKKYNWSTANTCNKCRHNLHHWNFTNENNLFYNRYKYLR